MTPARIAHDREWLAKHLVPLMDAGKNLARFDQDLPSRLPTYDPGYWTGLKLIALKYYLRPYLNILAKRLAVGYVDLFAGPGMNLIGDRRVPLPGSPLLPLMVRETANNRFFSHLYMCEKKPDYYAALRRRVFAYVPNGCETSWFEGDANKFVKQLPELVDEHGIGHCLVFIDPEGLDWKWDSMEILLRGINCDVIVNFPSAGLQRISTKRDIATRRTVARFLGISASELPYPVDIEWAIELYRENLAALGKNVSTEIMIASNGSFHYHLIPAVRKTATGSRWFKIWMDLRTRVHRLRGRILDLVAQQIEGELGVIG